MCVHCVYLCLEIQFRLRDLYLLMNNEIVYFPIVGDVLLIRFDIKSI